MLSINAAQMIEDYLGAYAQYITPTSDPVLRGSRQASWIVQRTRLENYITGLEAAAGLGGRVRTIDANPTQKNDQAAIERACDQMHTIFGRVSDDTARAAVVSLTCANIIARAISFTGRE